MDIKEYLKHHKMSCAKFAQKLDIHPNHIWMVANQKRGASYELAVRIEEMTNGEITRQEVRPDKSPRQRCPCCGKLSSIDFSAVAS